MEITYKKKNTRKNVPNRNNKSKGKHTNPEPFIPNLHTPLYPTRMNIQSQMKQFQDMIDLLNKIQTRTDGKCHDYFVIETRTQIELKT